MSRRSSNYYALMSLPWWVNLFLGVAGFFVARHVIPHVASDNPVLRGVAILAPSFAIPTLLFFTLFAAASLVHAWRRGELLDRQTSVVTIQNLSCKDFEFLVSEAYRRRGYAVQEHLGTGADGGIDLVLRKDGETWLVQCKNWRTRSIGVSTVRELFGVVVAEGATGGVVICSGKFSPDALDFARGKNIELVDGATLVRLVGRVQKRRLDTVEPPRAVYCPRCRSPMVFRTARRGARSGSTFWGCSRYPKCRGIRQA